MGKGDKIRITLAGPCAPSDLADLLFESDALEARLFSGYRGVPVSNLAKVLIQYSHKVFIVTTSRSIEIGKRIFKGPNLEIHVFPQRKRARVLALSFFKDEIHEMRKCLLEIDSEIIHAHWTYEFAMAALSTEKKVLLTAHDSPFSILRYYFDAYRLFRLFLAIRVRLKAKNITAVSNFLALKWNKQMFWMHKIPIIPNISPYPLLENRAYRDLAYRVLAIGDSSKLKNIQKLLSAWPKVLEVMPNSTLELIGYGLSDNDYLSKKINSKVKNESILFHGYQNRDFIYEKLLDADVLVHPSLHESQGLVLLEAMSLGVPIVAGKNSGAVPETVSNAGLLVNVKRTNELASAIIKLLSDKSLRIKLSKLGQSRVREFYSPKKVMQLYLDEYNRVKTNL